MSDKENRPPPAKMPLVQTAVELPSSEPLIAPEMNQKVQKQEISIPNSPNDESFQQYLFREQELRAFDSKKNMNLQTHLINMNEKLMQKFLGDTEKKWMCQQSTKSVNQAAY